jgi:hypothetical protein
MCDHRIKIVSSGQPIVLREEEERRTMASPRDFVESHQSQQQRNVQHGSVHEPLGAHVGLGAGRPQGYLNQRGTHYQGAKKV